MRLETGIYESSGKPPNFRFEAKFTHKKSQNWQKSSGKRQKSTKSRLDSQTAYESPFYSQKSPLHGQCRISRRQ